MIRSDELWRRFQGLASESLEKHDRRINPGDPDFRDARIALARLVSEQRAEAFEEAAGTDGPEECDSCCDHALDRLRANIRALAEKERSDA